jgi:signal transduction histidine kinase
VSRVARRVAVASLVVLGVQFAVALAIQVALSLTMRREVVLEVTRGLEAAGALDACAARPGPWAVDGGWWTIWPVAEDGRLVGAGSPTDRVVLPSAGGLQRWSGGSPGIVYGSPAPGCGGVLLLQRRFFPLMETQSARIAGLAGLRILLVLLAAVALVAVTAVPLVRRIQALAAAMNRVVESNFEGTVADGTDDELGEVARAFDAATATARERLERLEERDAVLRRALADLAHDLRTPLATLALSASSLPASTAATTIRSELGFLEAMTQNFEALLGGEEDSPRTLVALDRLVERVQHRFAPLARDRDIAFEVALPDEVLHVQADAVALERAASNLVHNALRFASDHVVLLLLREGEDVRLEVRDDGPGLGELSDRAVERGVRGAETAGVGFGLGLAIAEGAARRFGGRLELRDGEDGGALVALVLPLASAGSAPAAG